MQKLPVRIFPSVCMYATTSPAPTTRSRASFWSGRSESAKSRQQPRAMNQRRLSAAVSKYLAAIGFIGFAYINKNIPVRLLSTCGLESEPSKFTVKRETYPLARRLYLYTLGTPDDRIVRNLVTFALSDEAQKTVSDAGFIDQTVENQTQEVGTVSCAASKRSPFMRRQRARTFQGDGRAVCQIWSGAARTTLTFVSSNDKRPTRLPGKMLDG